MARQNLLHYLVTICTFASSNVFEVVKGLRGTIHINSGLKYCKATFLARDARDVSEAQKL